MSVIMLNPKHRWWDRLQKVTTWAHRMSMLVMAFLGPPQSHQIAAITKTVFAVMAAIIRHTAC